MAIVTIKRGENVIYTIPIMSSDATPVAVPIVANLQNLRVEVIQYGVVLANYIFLPTPDPVHPQIRVGSSTHYCNVEITEALSLLFLEGAVDLKVYMGKTDAAFIVDLQLKDIDQFQALDVTF